MDRWMDDDDDDDDSEDAEELHPLLSPSNIGTLFVDVVNKIFRE